MKEKKEEGKCFTDESMCFNEDYNYYNDLTKETNTKNITQK